MSIESELYRIITAKNRMLNSIIGKGVTDITAATPLDEYPDYIDQIETGGGGGFEIPDPNKPIKFYDYDGMLLYSYTIEEVQELTELPPLPTREGLICQSWNWTLADIKALDKAMNIGALYITDDGATRLHIRLSDVARNVIPLYFYQSVASGVTISWGDGSGTETVSGTGNVNTSHTYTAVGDYIISLIPLSNCTFRLGHGSSGYCVLGPVNNNTRVITSMLREVNYGNKTAAITAYTFQYCRNLKYVSLPNTATTLGNYTFSNCTSLVAFTVSVKTTSIPTFAFGYCYGIKTICLPAGVTSIAASAMRYCYSLSDITIPPKITSFTGYCFSECYSIQYVSIPAGVTTMSNFIFNKCYSLSDVVLPEGLTSIGSNVFYQNYALSSVNIPSTVTTIGSNAFYDCHSLQKITIPAGVTSIGTNAFYNCYGVKEYVINAATPPTLSTSAFTGIADDCIISIPAGSLESYVADSNWANFAAYIQERQ